MRTLYLGLDPQHYEGPGELVHIPIIKICPFPLTLPTIQDSFALFPSYTHLIFTSKSSVELTKEALIHFNYPITLLSSKTCIAVGTATAKKLEVLGLSPLTATTETAEGVIALLKEQNLQHAHLFWPHSALSRPVIREYLEIQKIAFKECALYTTQPNDSIKPASLPAFDEIVFTSPSTVEAYIQIMGSLPKQKKIIAIGPITAEKLRSCGISPFVRK